MFNWVKDFPLLFPIPWEDWCIWGRYWNNIWHVLGSSESPSCPISCFWQCSTRDSFEITHEPLKDHFLLFIILVSTQTFTVAGFKVLSVKPSLAWVFKVMRMPEMLKKFLCHEDYTTGVAWPSRKAPVFLSFLKPKWCKNILNYHFFSQPLPAMLFPPSFGADLNPKL